MKVITETSLKDFEFWGGARQVASLLTDEEFETLDADFEEMYSDGLTATEINDTFWFDSDMLAESLGYENYEQMFEDRTQKEPQP